MNIIEAMQDVEIFGGDFQGKSWAPWFTLWRTLFGLPMSETDLALFRQCTGRTAPNPAGYVEAWLICGRSGGKSRALAATAVYLSCFRDWRPFLSRGETGVVAVIARDVGQAKVIFDYIKAMLLDTPILCDQVRNVTRRNIELHRGVTIEVNVCDFRSIRGRTIITALCDELAYWKSADSATPDVEMLNALRPAMRAIPGAMLLAASSPFGRHGELYETHKRYHGRDDAAPLTWVAPTRVMNPSYPQAKIDAEMSRDEPRARAEYLCEWRGDLEGYIKLGVVLGCTGPYEKNQPVEGVTYVCFVDPSGGGPDSYAAAIAHREKDRIIVDALYESGPNYSPNRAVEEIVSFIRPYRIHKVVGDRFGGAATHREAFGRHHVGYRDAEKNRTELYQSLLPLFNSAIITIPRNDTLTQQLVSLQRRVHPSGRESIDHAPGRHDDLANVCAGVAELCALVNQTPVAAFGRYGFEYDNDKRSKFDGDDPETGGFATSSKLGGLRK